jgi:hypothetical protein
MGATDKAKAPKRTRTKATVVPGRSRVTCWLSAEACHKLELAVIDRKCKTGKRNVEYGEIIEDMLLDKFSNLSLVVTHVERSPRPSAPAEASPADSIDSPTSQPENS